MKRVKFLLLLMAALFFGLQPLQAGTGRINADGTMDFSVNFRYPPTAADIANMRAMLQQANNIICDATDGQLRFGTVRLTAGGAHEDEADIWVYAEGGRSAVSFFTDGSSFGTLGDHITLFQGGITGGTIAHELAHLAFGLGDEYSEQCRWGGPCGIGPCFDAAGPNLMMQSGDQSELCVAANHDPLQGNNDGCPLVETCAGMGVCAAGNCNLTWNSTTNRFETTQQTLIHPGLSAWETLDQNYPAQITPPAGLPNNNPPGGCGAPAFIEDVTGSDQVMLFIDRSGSMGSRINSADPASQTRLDFARAAARALIDLRAGNGMPLPQMGLVAFDHNPVLVRNIIDLPLADRDPFKTQVDNLTLGGTTAIGTALNAAIFPFQAVEAAGRTRTAFLLSDGQNNTGVDPETAAATLRGMGVRIFTIPVGDAADRSLLADIASTSGGAMLDAPVGDELPAIYFELAARSRGESLNLARTPMAVRGRRSGGDDVFIYGNIQQGALPLADTVGFEVEPFSGRLDVILSTRHSRVNTWQPNFTLRGPNGEEFTQNDKDVLSTDPYYILIRLDNPSAGRWVLGISSGNGLSQFTYVAAHAENPQPDLMIDARPRIVNPGQEVVISALATYGATLEEGVTYTGRVKRPDGSFVPVAFTSDPYTRKISAVFNQFNGNGVYEVQVRCDVAAGATLMPGESIFAGPETLPVSVEPFTRATTTAFILKGDGTPPCSGNDCDNDGIPNDQDGDDDPDGDGRPSYQDTDSDGDDVPDADEGTRDTDQDGIDDHRDTDSDNDGIIDGLDPDNKVGAVDNQRRWWISAHAGSAHPLSALDEVSDANIHAHADLTYRLRDNLNLKLMLGISQFTAESSAGLQHPRFWHANANVQLILPRPLNMKPYLQAGPGVYRDKSNVDTFGWNAGIGCITRINPELYLSAGLDYHDPRDDARSRFLAAHLGMLFR